MIIWNSAPAGFIAQFFSDGPVPNQEPTLRSKQERVFLDVTGEWCQTYDEAIRSVIKERPKKLKKEMKKLRELEMKVLALRSMIKALEEASESSIKEK